MPDRLPRLAGTPGDLDPGYYVLTAEPVKKGIIDMSIRPASLSAAVNKAYSALSDMAKDAARSIPGGKDAERMEFRALSGPLSVFPRSR